MGSTFSSVPKVLKKSVSCFSGDVGEWEETAASFTIRVAVPGLRRDDSAIVDSVQRGGRYRKLVVAGQLRDLGRSFEKSIKIPDTPGGGGAGLLVEQASVRLQAGYLVVTVPKFVQA